MFFRVVIFTQLGFIWASPKRGPPERDTVIEQQVKILNSTLSYLVSDLCSATDECVPTYARFRPAAMQ